MNFDNLVAYSAQVALLVAGAYAGGRALGLRGSAYALPLWQVVLVACLLLPVVEPWRMERIVEEAQFAPARAAAAIPLAPGGPSLPWRRAVVWIVGLGCVARLAWLGLGLVRLRALRGSSSAMAPPETVGVVSEQVGVEAEWRVSTGVSGPVTFGLRRPVVLVPPEFPALSAATQRAIAAHELLHVRRRDWLLSLVEEAAASLLWFHPAIWWLAGEIRLSREQAVDRRAAALTGSREEYAGALLAAAGRHSGLREDLLPAPLFVRRGQLAARIGTLMKETAMSRMRLISACTASAAAMGTALWFGLAWFPLVGQAQVVDGPAKDPSGVIVDPGGRILHRGTVMYPGQALLGRVEGRVEVEATLAGDGSVTDARVISGPEALRKAALTAALDFHYQPEGNGGKRLAVFDFRLPPAPAKSGDSGNAAASSGVLEKVDVSALPEALRQTLTSRTAQLEGRPFSTALMDEIREAVRAVDPHITYLWRTNPQTRNSTVALSLGPPPPVAPPSRIRVGGNVQSAKIQERVAPRYPAEAKAQRIQGTVRLAVIISKEGRVAELSVESGDPVLAPAAVEAVRQWVWNSTLLNGVPVEVETRVDINFTLAP